MAQRGRVASRGFGYGPQSRLAAPARRERTGEVLLSGNDRFAGSLDVQRERGVGGLVVG